MPRERQDYRGVTAKTCYDSVYAQRSARCARERYEERCAARLVVVCRFMVTMPMFVVTMFLPARYALMFFFTRDVCRAFTRIDICHYRLSRGVS